MGDTDVEDLDEATTDPFLRETKVIARQALDAGDVRAETKQPR